MPFLVLNGVTVPVAAAESETALEYETVGSFSRADDGSRLGNLVGYPRRLPIRTPPLAQEFAASLRGLACGEFDTFRFSADAFSGKGLGPSGTYVAALRPGEGKFTNGAIAVETTATNLLDTTAKQTFVTGGGWNTFGGSVITLTQGQALSYNGDTLTANGATRIQSTGGSSVLKYYFEAGTGSAGTPCAVSVWVKNQMAVTLTVSDNLGNVVTVAAGVTAKVRAATASVNGVAGRHIEFRVPSASDTLDIIAFQPQVEVNYQDTTFAATPRGTSGYLPYAVTRDDGLPPWEEFTVAGWFRAGRNPDYRMFAGAWSDWYFSTNGSANNDLLVSWTDPAGVQQSLTTGAVAGLDVTAGYVHLAVTYHRPTTTLRIYTGGVLRATSTTATFRAASAFVGVFGWGAISGQAGATYPLNGRLSECAFAPFRASAEIIAALAARTAFIPGAPGIEATGFAYGSSLVTVEGDDARLVRIPGASAKWSAELNLVEV